MAGRRFYWLKLKKDFFKRHDIRILEKMEHGHDIVLLYIKLLCESLDHDGNLRFSDTLPYTTSMISAIMDFPEDVVKSAMKLYQDFGLVTITKDDTIHMNHLDDMIGVETDWAEKKRRQRENVKPSLESVDNVPQVSSETGDNVKTDEGQKVDMSDKRIENREKRIENRDKIDLEREKEREKSLSPSPSIKRFVKPSVDDVKAYCEGRKNSVDAERFVAYYESVGWRIGGKSPMRDWRAAVRTWERRQTSEPQTKRKPDEIPIMENTYDFSDEGIEKKLEDSRAFLDSLLED